MIEKYKQLVTMLLALTDEGKAEWEKTSTNEYKVGVGKNYISVLYHEATPHYYDMDEEPDVSFLKLSLWNEDGELLDDVKIENRRYGSTDYDKLMELYTAARRAYGKVYETLDSIISVLEKAVN